MFGIRRSKSQGETVIMKINGMHCVSCSLNIDGELEDTPGVVSAHTSYARSMTRLMFDPHKTTLKQLTSVIEKLGYTVELIH